MNQLVLLFLLVSALLPPFATATSPGQEPSASQKAVPSGETYYHTLLALQYEREGKSEEALAEYERALAEDQESPFLLTQAGITLTRLNRSREALVYLEKAKALQPSGFRTLNVLGDLYAAGGEMNKAAATYEELIAQKPKEMESYLILARLFLAQKNTDQAIATIERGVQADPSSALGPYYLAKLFVQKKEYEKGLDQYQKSIQVYPGFEKAHLERGSLYEQMGKAALAEEGYRHILKEASMDHEEAGIRLIHLLIQRGALDDASAILDRLLQEDSDNPDLLLKSSLIWSERKEFARAIEPLRKIMAMRPQSLELTLYLASLYEEMADYPNALLTYQEALQKEGDLYPVHLRLGALYFYHLKKMPEALSEGERAKAIDPKRPEAYLFTGLILHELERFEEAAEVLEEGVETAPTRVDLHFHLGVAYDKLGRFEALVREMERTIALDPSHAMALNYLGYTYADQGVHLDEAALLINRALALRPDDGYIMDSLGWVYYKQGKVKEGLAWIQKAVGRVPNDPIILEHLGELYLKENQRDQARDAWSRSLKIDAHNEKLKARLREAGFVDAPSPSGT
jgi:tetratricopeptide (TPR) repeat protein